MSNDNTFLCKRLHAKITVAWIWQKHLYRKCTQKECLRKDKDSCLSIKFAVADFMQSQTKVIKQTSNVHL